MYTIKELNSHHEYQISSFTTGKEPEKVYKVSLRGNSAYCTCPGFPKTPGASHKHVRMVKAWLAAGSPWLAAIDFDDKNQPIIETHIPVEKP